MGVILQFRPRAERDPLVAPWDRDEVSQLSDVIETIRLSIGAINTMTDREPDRSIQKTYQTVAGTLRSQAWALEEVYKGKVR